MQRTVAGLWPIMLAVCAAGLAWAGPTGLIWIPATDLQPEHSVYLGVGHYQPADPADSATCAVATYGLTDRCEFGLDVLLDDPDPLYFNGKALLCEEGEGRPALAVGLQGWGTRAGVTDFNLAYLLLAKTVGPVRLTAGYCHGNAGTLGADPDMLLLGLDGYLDPDEKWWGAVDYQSGQNGWGALSVGLCRTIAADGVLTVGYNRYNDRTLGDTLYVGVGWTVGGKKEAASDE